MAFPTSVNDIALGASEYSEDLGPLLAKAIISERDKDGPFKNGADLAARVGLSAKLVSELETRGLITVVHPA